MSDSEDLRAQAMDVILTKIVESTPRSSSGVQTRNLAEAYAWLVNSSQSHGGHSDAS